MFQVENAETSLCDFTLIMWCIQCIFKLHDEQQSCAGICKAAGFQVSTCGNWDFSALQTTK